MKRTNRSTLRPFRGFTLIELLIVIAILSILAAMLLPSLASSKKLVQAYSCLNNHRQLYLSFTSYAEDNKDWLPEHVRQQAGHVSFFYDQLGGYLTEARGSLYNPKLTTRRNFPVLACPALTGLKLWNSYFVSPLISSGRISFSAYRFAIGWNLREFTDDMSKWEYSLSFRFGALQLSNSHVACDLPNFTWLGTRRRALPYASSALGNGKTFGTPRQHPISGCVYQSSGRDQNIYAVAGEYYRVPHNGTPLIYADGHAKFRDAKDDISLRSRNKCIPNSGLSLDL